MIGIDVRDWFELDGQLWQVLTRDPDRPGELVARRTRDLAIERFTIAELLGEPGFVNASQPDAHSIANLQQLAYASDEEVSRAEAIAQAIDESAGAAAGAERVRSISASLHGKGIAVSDRQIYRYIAAYQRSGLPGLLRRQPGPQDPRPSLHVDVVAILEELMKEQVNLSTGTRSRLIRQAEWRAAERGVTLPSRSTLYRLLQDLDAGRSTFGNATTRRSKAQRPARPYQRQSPLRPGERVEIDSTPLDLFVVMPDQSIARPELTCARDVATGSICATLLRPKGTTAYDVGALLLARMMTPMTLQTSWPGRLQLARSIFGDAIPSDSEWNRLASESPTIVPESITTDRGMAFRGTTFTAACSRLEISLNIARPHQPTDKPHVESGFRQIRERFVQFLAGFTGYAVTLRGLDPSKDAVWSLEEVQMLLDLWVLSDWQTTPQEGLRLATSYKVPLSPNQMFRALTAAAPHAGRTLSFEERLALLPSTFRKIQHYGINFEHLTYDSPDLYPLQGRQAPYKTPQRGQWEVRYDPYDMSSLWVRGPVGWIRAEWTLAPQVCRPFSQEVAKAAYKAISKDRTPTPVELLREIDRIQTGRLLNRHDRRAFVSEATAVQAERPSPVPESPEANADADPVPTRSRSTPVPLLAILS